jgi:hypothetical protein
MRQRVRIIEYDQVLNSTRSAPVEPTSDYEFASHILIPLSIVKQRKHLQNQSSSNQTRPSPAGSFTWHVTFSVTASNHNRFVPLRQGRRGCDTPTTAPSATFNDGLVIPRDPAKFHALLLPSHGRHRLSPRRCRGAENDTRPCLLAQGGASGICGQPTRRRSTDQIALNGQGAIDG